MPDPSDRDDRIPPSIGTDVTAPGPPLEGHLRATRQQLLEARQMLREAEQIARMGRWEHDLVSGSLSWSQGIYELFEVSSESFGVSYQSFMSFVHPDDRAAVDATYHQSVASRTPYETLHRLLMPDGRIKWVTETGRIEYAADGTPARAVGVVQDVTARRAAEEQLRRNEFQLRLALYAANQGLFDRNVETGEETVSDEYAQMLGYGPAEMHAAGGTWADRLHPDDRAPALHRFASYVSGQSHEYRVECRHQRKDGTWKWVLSLGSIVEWTPAGRPLRMLGTYTDIDERKRTEQALESRIVALTQPAAAAEAVKFSDLFDTEELQRFQDAFAGAMGVASLITEPDGTPITRASHFCRLCRDIVGGTEKGQADCARTEAELRQFDPAGPTVRPCPAGLLGAGASVSVGGRHLASWMIGQVRTEDLDHEALCRYADEIGADRGEFEEAFAAVPIMSRERFEQAAQAVLTLSRQLSIRAFQNITQARFIAERKRADEERASLESQLHHARQLEAVGRLAGGVAHDLNNMLAPILGYGELLGEDLPPEDPRRPMVDEIVSAAQRARELVRQLLAFGRRQTIDPKPVDLSRLVRGLAGILRRSVREDVAIDMRLLPDVALVRADPGQIEQVILNLAMNAQDAMPGGGALTFETGMAELSDEDVRRDPGGHPGRHVVLSVRDTGSGMDADTLDHVFDPFFTTKEIGKGRGLGLATVYGVVKQHGGSVAVTSEVGRGTCFRLYFPCVPNAAEAVTPAAPVAAGAAAGTVLLVEDQQQVREMVMQSLRRSGYTVLAATSGEEALRVADEHAGEIGLLLTDVVMAGMNGQELRRRLRSLRPGVPVLFMSGHASDVLGEQGVLDAGVHFIQKPFSLGALVGKVVEAMAGKEAG